MQDSSQDVPKQMRPVSPRERRQLFLRRFGPLALAFVLAPALLLLRWQIAPPSVSSLDLGDPGVSASHFYNVEHSPEHAFRWSRELSAVSLPALASSQVVSLTLNPARPAGEAMPHVHLLVNGRQAGDIVLQPGWQTYTVSVGAGLGPDIRLVLESDTFYPGAGDRRRLGVATAIISTAATQNRLGILLPPLLWLLLGLVTPLLAWWAARLSACPPRRRAIVTGLAALVPTLASLLPPSLALPFYGWIAGLGGAACLLWSAYKLQFAPAVVACLRRLARSRWELVAVGALGATLAVGATWPVTAHLTDSLPGWPADNFAFLYKLWWFRTALVQQHVSPFFDPGSYAPFGFNLGQGEPTLINTLPGAVIGTLTSDVVAYNLLALSSFVVSMLGGYLLVREVTGSRAAALLGGIAFAFCPYRTSQFAGHLQLLGTGWIALAFFFLERLLKRGRWRQGIFLGIALGLAALSAWYYAYLVAVGLVVYFVLRAFSLRRDLQVRRVAGGLLAGAAVFLLLASPVAVPSLQLWQQGDLTHSAKAADENSAAPLDYVVPNPLQPVWGQPAMQARSEENVIESALYPGLPVAVIACAGWWWSRKRKGKWKVESSESKVKSEKSKVEGTTFHFPLSTRSFPWYPWLGLGLVCFVLSLGLTLHDAGGQMKIGGGPLALPGQLLYDWLPLYSSMRAFARFGILVMLACAALLGLGWAGLLRRGPAWLRMRPLFATLVAAVLILADFWTGPYSWGTTTVQPTATAQYLAQQSPGTVMQMPLLSSQSGPALFQHIYYNKPIAYGYETFEPVQWAAKRDQLEDFPSDRCLDVLASWGVRYIVVSANAYGADWLGMLQQLKSLPRLRYLAGFNEDFTWNVDPAVLDARPDMDDYAQPDTPAVFELVR